MDNSKEGQDIMTGEDKREQETKTTAVPVPKVKQALTNPKGAAIQKRDPEKPIEDPSLADAEEEEFAQLWEGDKGNQGA
jgi:hypothetical protein